jgi:hypothetical protein
MAGYQKPKPRGWFYLKAADYSLWVPPFCLAAFIGVQFLGLTNLYLAPALAIVLVVLFTGIVAGLITLWGSSEPGVKQIVWKAILGIVAAGALGLYVFKTMAAIAAGVAP